MKSFLTVTIRGTTLEGGVAGRDMLIPEVESDSTSSDAPISIPSPIDTVPDSSIASENGPSEAPPPNVFMLPDLTALKLAASGLPSDLDPKVSSILAPYATKRFKSNLLL